MYNRFILGMVSGMAVTATGFYLYQRNKDTVDAFLRNQGINLPASRTKDFSQMNLEELVATKERIEDLIAEIEFAKKQTGQVT